MTTTIFANKPQHGVKHHCTLAIQAQTITRNGIYLQRSVAAIIEKPPFDYRVANNKN